MRGLTRFVRAVRFPGLVGGALLVGAAAPACSAAETDETDVITRGHDLFHSRSLSPSLLNVYTCATCHDVEPSEEASWLKPGAPLAGATLRPSFWNGQVADLAAAIEQCRLHFMVARDPLDPEDPDARALYAFLASTEPGQPEPVAFSIPRDISPLPRGAAESGHVVYTRACSYCHGVLHSGAGRSSLDTPILPEDTSAGHEGYTPRSLRLVFIEKVRHGRFYGYGGHMPPFSLEVLNDTMLSDLLEALGITGE